MIKALGTAAIAFACCVNVASAADLPKSTQEMLGKLKLGPSYMDDLTKELAVPQNWIDGAKKEQMVRIVGSWDNEQFRVLSQPFSERYPFIKITYTRGETNARIQKPLLAFKEGRIIIDVITGIGDEIDDFMAVDAVDNLKDFPAYDSVPAQLKRSDGFSVSAKLRYWCMSYNTDALKAADLPKTWDDLVSDKALGGGKLGVNSEAQLWLLPLAGAKGDDWVRSTIKGMFDNLQPVRRQESVNALQGLVIAGEIKAALPAADYRVGQYVRKGAPISWHCPEPVPTQVSGMALIKGSPYTNAAHLFGNWLISKEGQVAQFIADGATPVHKDMQSKEFLAFPDEIAGKPLAFVSPEESRAKFVTVLNAWTPYWTQVK